MDNAETSDHQIARMRGCARLGLFLLKAAALIATLWFVVVTIPKCNIRRDMGHGQTVRVQMTMHDLHVAISNFKAEYHHFPIDGDKDLVMRSEGILLLALLGEHESMNPRKVSYINLPLAKKGVYGLVDPAGGKTSSPRIELHDPWGERYRLILDLDNDSKVPNPEAGADAKWLAKHPQSATLNTAVAIYSSGPDRDPTTWEDNITSWQ